MAKKTQLERCRTAQLRCMFTLLCAVTVCILSREYISLAKDVTAMAITGNLTHTGTALSQITIPHSTPENTRNYTADITRASKKVHSTSSAILRNLSITQNKNVWDNLHWYKFSMNAVNCKGRSPIVAVIVHTAISNAHKRQKIRKDTHGRDSNQEPWLTVVFLLGETKNASLQAEVVRESQKYQDIVQGNFIDSYHNLTHKHIMGYHWVIMHCQNVRYVIKIDDDVVVHVGNVFGYLWLNPFPEGHIMCSVQKLGKKNTAGKWAISEQEYPFIRYPPYCAGFAYITTLSVVKRLHAASTHIKSIWIDDVYATGILALATNTKLIGFPTGQYYNGLKKPPARYNTEGMFVLYRDSSRLLDHGEKTRGGCLFGWFC